MLNRPNHNCFTCGGTVKFTHVESIHTRDLLSDPWIKVEGEEMLKLLVFKMLPAPQKPALARSPLENTWTAGGGIVMKIIATVRYQCKTCGTIEVQHTHNRLNEGCCGCGVTIAFERVRNIHTSDLLGDPWIKVEGEEMLKLLVFQMLPAPQQPALASPPP
jgi:hypothetical protein